MQKHDASIKPYYVMDKKGNKTALFIDVAAFKDLVEAFGNLQSDTSDNPTLTHELEYLNSEIAFKKASLP